MNDRHALRSKLDQLGVAYRAGDDLGGLQLTLFENTTESLLFEPTFIVDYPAGAPLPEPGSTLNRDESRPYEITEVRRQSDGQLNVFVREIIQP